MNFFRSLFAWVVAACVGYFFASAFSTHFVLSDLAALGAPVTLEDRISTTLDDLVALYLYFLVIVAGFLIAFFIASLVKAILPVLSVIAYPVSGAAAIWVALYLINLSLGFELGGVRTDIGYAFQMLAGAIGGLTFEMMRAKED